MSKILKNQTASPVVIGDAGATVPASGSYTIPPIKYLAFSISSDTIGFLADGTLLFNDGVNDIDKLAQATDLLMGWFPGGSGGGGSNEGNHQTYLDVLRILADSVYRTENDRSSRIISTNQDLATIIENDLIVKSDGTTEVTSGSTLRIV